MLGSYRFGPLIDLSVLSAFAVVMVGLGSLAFKRMKL
jgi:hypothetical protein